MAEYSFEQLPIIGQFYFAEDDKDKYKSVNKFNKAFWPNGERIDELTQTLLDEYQAVNRIRTASQKEQYFNTLKIIVSNLIVAYKSKKSFIAIQLGSKEFLCNVPKYEPVRITRTVFKNLIDWLVGADYLNLYRASNNPSLRVSSMLELLPSIKEWIDDYELKYKDVIMHDDYRYVQKKQGDELVDYEDTEETQFREGVLKEYSRLLSDTEITIDNEPISKPVSLRSLLRGDDKSYGRINGGEWMNCKGELRKTIEIEKEETVEIDISNCSIRLASNLNGIDIPQEINVYAMQDIDEELVKKISIIMQNIDSSSTADGLNKVTGAVLNSYTKEVANKIAIRDIQGGGDGRTVASAKKRYLNTHQSNKEIMTANGIPYTRQELREVVNKVYSYHSKFADGWLLCGRGLELQYKESQVTFKVIEKFLELGKVVLTIHDSFITTVTDEEILVEVINNSYKEVVGYLPKLSYK